MLVDIAKNPMGFVPQVKDARGVGTNIIGFLLMFILLQCVLFMFTLSEDIESKKIERIASAPVSFIKYLLSHFVGTVTHIFVPAFAILLVMNGIFGLNIGFSLWQYVVLLGLLCSFGTAFAMFINSVVKGSDTANMVGSSIIVLTTILSGSFYSIEKGNEVLEKAIWILPQKAFLSFVQGLEGGRAVSAMLPQLSYVIMVFTLSYSKTKKRLYTTKVIVVRPTHLINEVRMVRITEWLILTIFFYGYVYKVFSYSIYKTKKHYLL